MSILLIDDGIFENALDVYKPLLRNNETHHILFLNEKMAIINPVEERLKLGDRLMNRYNLASSSVLTLPQTINYLQECANDFEKIYMDGLERVCFDIIKKASLNENQYLIVTNNPYLVDECKGLKIPCMEKCQLDRTEIRLT